MNITPAMILIQNKLGDSQELFDYLEKSKIIPYIVYYKTSKKLIRETITFESLKKINDSCKEIDTQNNEIHNESLKIQEIKIDEENKKCSEPKSDLEENKEESTNVGKKDIVNIIEVEDIIPVNVDKPCKNLNVEFSSPLYNLAFA